MSRGKLRPLVLDRRTLLMGAELAEGYDKCAICALPLTETEKHARHRQAVAVQKIAQTVIAGELRALAATASDLKGRRRDTPIS